MTRLIAVDISVGRLGIAVTCAVVAAFSYALSNVLQQHEAEQIPEDKTLKLGLLAQLAHRPRWLVGMGADVGGYVFEALALGTGTLVLVEPILATSLLLSLFLGAVINRRHVDRAGWTAAVVLAFGVSVFLFVVAPTRGPTSRRPARGSSPLRRSSASCSCASRPRGLRPDRAGRRSSVSRPARCSARSAVLTKAFVHYLGGGVLNWVPHWEPYALAVSSITGLVLAQSAFQTGGLAVVVGAEQVMQPLTGVAFGVGLLDERLGISGSVATITLIAALAAMLWGVLTLARVEHADVLGRLPPSPTGKGRRRLRRIGGRGARASSRRITGRVGRRALVSRSAKCGLRDGRVLRARTRDRALAGPRRRVRRSVVLLRQRLRPQRAPLEGRQRVEQQRALGREQQRHRDTV